MALEIIEISDAILNLPQMPIGDNRLWISGYQPFLSTKDQFETSLKSNVQKLWDTKYLQDFPKLKTKFTQFIKESLQRIKQEGFSRSVAFFINFLPSKIESEGFSQDIFFKVVQLNQQIKPNFTVAECPELRPLIAEQVLAEPRLALHLVADQARLYIWQQDNCRLAETFQNYFTTQQEDRYIQQFSVGSTKNIYHGTGSQKPERQAEAGLQYWSKQVLGKITHRAISFNHIVVLLSDAIEPSLQEQLALQLNGKFTEVTLIASNPDTVDQVGELLHQQVVESYQQRIHQFKDGLKQDPSSFEENKSQILIAATQGKVAELLVSSHQDTPAGVPILVSQVLQGEVEETQSLEALVTTLVLRNGGRVLVDTTTKPGGNYQMVARKRY